ncbi:MAG: IS21 family transposase [Pirellulales bacterium]
MANVLKMAIVQSILHLHSLQWSRRRIARELGIDRGTVGRCLLRQLRPPNAAISPAGSAAPNAATFWASPAPGERATDDAASADWVAGSNAAISPTGSPASEADRNAADQSAVLPADHDAAACRAPSAAGRKSECQPWRELIEAKLAQGLSAQRIWQDLRSDHGFAAGYDSVKRFVKRLGRSRPLPFRRMEVAPGDEAQADFGAGAPIVTGQLTPRGKPQRKKTHLFRIVLSHSRKAYSEVTYRQTTDDFLRVLENAFWHFGGVPKVLVIDNLKAAVKQADWYDPELVPKVAAFAAHYGVAILPTKPRTPRHKGKTERGVGYGQENALKGHTFTSLEAQNEHLLHWETSVADTRIHGTTKKQVGQAFREVEQPALQPLPHERFSSFHEAQRVVNRDGHIEVAKAYYSVPPEYLGLKVWARWDARTVRVFNLRMQEIALHARHEQGRFSTQGAHIAREKISGLEQGAALLLKRVKGTRPLMGLISLTKKHDYEALEKACETAHSHGAFRLRVLRALLKRSAPKQQSLPLLDEHPLIRPLDDYAAIVAAAQARQADRRRRDDEGFTRHGSGVRREHQQVSPDGNHHQGSDACSTRPRSGYPLAGCSSAEPASVSPDCSTVVRDSFPR